MSEYQLADDYRADVDEVRVSDDTWWGLFRMGAVSYDLLAPGADRFGVLQRAFESLREKEKIIREIRPAGADEAPLEPEPQQPRRERCSSGGRADAGDRTGGR